MPLPPTDGDQEPVPYVLEPPPNPGWIAPDVVEEHPGLDFFWWTEETEWRRRAPRWARDRLARLSTRIDGPAVLQAHLEDAPAAHREFLRRIGRDPNSDHSPQEAAYHQRIFHGRFPVRDELQDLLLIVLIETGVPIWAVDAERIDGELGLRRSLAGELQGPRIGPGRPTPDPITRSEPVVVDGGGVVAELGREPRDTHRATYKTGRTTFFCARVPGLPALRVEEAIWLCRTLGDRAA